MLAAGTMLLHYRVLRPLGRGGMGEVYLAQDTVLGRQVALKLVLAEAAHDAERRARFAAEARVIAALNHPNIVTVHAVEHEGEVHFIAMEYVAGKPLSAMIPSGRGLPLKQFLDIVIPLTDAVAAAHQQGIIHRDLKPQNVMASDDGRVKVLDFGLAKLRTVPSESADTVMATSGISGEGRVLGTVDYMSPEQAQGQVLDHRSDIFSLGVLMFEMTTGRRPFPGDNSASVVSSILRDVPTPVTQLNPAVPAALDRVIQRCLAKDPSRRYQSTLDLRNDLLELKETVDSRSQSAVTIAPPRRSRTWTYVAAAAAVIAALAAVTFLMMRSPGERDEPVREAEFVQLTHGAGAELFPSLSPDGRTIAYVSAATGNMDIYTQRVGGENAVNLTATSAADDLQPAYSPDGDRIAFRSERDGGGIFVMGATGESVRRVTREGFHPAWSPDGRYIAYVTQSVTDPAMRFTTSQMWIVTVDTGERRLLTEGDAVQPSWSPDGSRIAYWGRAATGGTGDIYTIPAAGGPVVAVTSEASLDWNPVWAPDGAHLYFASDRGGSTNLWRVPVDQRTGNALARPVAVTTGGGASNQHITVSRDGARLAYVSRFESTNVQKAAFDAVRGTLRSVPDWVTRGTRAAAQPHPSPDGTLLAFNSLGKQEDIFVAATDGTGIQQLTSDPFEDRAARWDPSGQRIAFYSNRTGKYEIWTINRDGSDLQQLTHSPGAHYPVWSPKGDRMAFSTHSPNGAFIFSTGVPWNEQRPEPLPAVADKTQTFEIWSWSPDGRHLAGQRHLADLSHAGIGIHELGSGQIRWITDTGEWPVWLRDSRRLLFSDRNKLYLVDSDTRARHEVLALPQTTLGSVGISTDNATIYFTLRAVEADVWLMTMK